MSGHAHGGWLAPALALLAAVALYGAAAWAATVRGRPARPWRALCWAGGAGLAALAFAPPVAAHAHHDLRAHMAQHLLLGMLAPIGLALGAPFTLALRALPAGAARRAVALLHSPPLRALGHPATAAALSVGGMGLLYLTPLYALSLRSGALHAAVHAHFLVAGYLFSWAVLAQEPAALPASLPARVGALFVAGAGHAVLAKLILAWGLPAGVAVGLGQRLDAAQLMYYGGDLAGIALAISLFAGWYRRAGVRRGAARRA